MGGKLVLMASRALARTAKSPADYEKVYGRILAQVREPAIIHWLGEMFDPALAGYWGAPDHAVAMETCLGIVAARAAKIDGVKISLLSKDKEIAMRRRLPTGVKMYTGDDFNYAELIAGDEQGYSDALLGIFDAIAPAASAGLARLASGGRYGFAQSVFQVGGSAGSSMGPVLAALFVVPFGQPSIAWFSSIAFLAIVILWRIGIWYRPQIAARKFVPAAPHPDAPDSRRVMIALAVLVALLFSKQLYVSSLSSYYMFYLIDKFGVSTQAAQIYLFVFLAANAIGAFFGGPLGDRFGRKYVIWFSILGALPFTLALPHAGLLTGAVLTVFIGLIISSTTSSIIVFAQELMPHRFGMISGVFFGVAFGIGGLGAAVLGKVADHTGIAFVYQVCAFLPAIGLLAVFLPKMPKTAH